MLEFIGIVILLVALDAVIGTYRLQHWLGLAKKDDKWQPDQQNLTNKVAVVTSAFGANTAHKEGLVELNGATWTARPIDGAQNFEDGDNAKVVKIDGLTLVVRKIED